MKDYTKDYERACKITSYLKQNDIYPESVCVNDNTAEVRIDGDWKHEHRRCDFLMEKEGHTYVGYKDEAEDDGGDCGEYTHIYTFKN